MMRLYFFSLNWGAVKALNYKKEKQIIVWILQINLLKLWPDSWTQLGSTIVFQFFNPNIK